MPLIRPEDDKTVWRYMSFGRFLYVLHTKSLWFPRIDQVGDPWELNVSPERFDQLVSIEHGGRQDRTREEVEADVRKALGEWRLRTFVSCWSGNKDESHALWKIYCPSPEGVAIQTTVRRLREALKGSVIDLYQVDYRDARPRPLGRASTRLTELATEKRTMFRYEDEVRALLKLSEPDSTKKGVLVAWDFGTVADKILVHPEADDAFLETVKSAVALHAPAIKGLVENSAMKARPSL